MATYQQGVVTTESGVYGLVQSVTQNTSAEKAEAADESGDVAAIQFFNEVSDVTVEVVFDTAKTPPDVGDEVTLSGMAVNDGKYYVDAVSLIEENKAYMRMSLTLKRYLTNGLPA